MLEAFFLLAAGLQDTPEQLVDQEEIVVNGRLQRLQVHLQNGQKGNGISCSITRSSGDSAFDRTACETTARCYGKQKIGKVSRRKYDAVSRCVHDRLIAYERTRSAAKEQ